MTWKFCSTFEGKVKGYVFTKHFYSASIKRELYTWLRKANDQNKLTGAIGRGEPMSRKQAYEWVLYGSEKQPDMLHYLDSMIHEFKWLL